MFTLSPYGPLLVIRAKGIVQDMVNLDYVSFLLSLAIRPALTCQDQFLIVPELRVSH